MTLSETPDSAAAPLPSTGDERNPLGACSSGTNEHRPAPGAAERRGPPHWQHAIPFKNLLMQTIIQRVSAVPREGKAAAARAAFYDLLAEENGREHVLRILVHTGILPQQQASCADDIVLREGIDRYIARTFPETKQTESGDDPRPTRPETPQEIRNHVFMLQQIRGLIGRMLRAFSQK